MNRSPSRGLPNENAGRGESHPVGQKTQNDRTRVCAEGAADGMVFVVFARYPELRSSA